MKRQARGKEEAVSFQITPMIDMTFLLLIFFMVTSKLSKEQVKMDVNLPTASAAKIPDGAEADWIRTIFRLPLTEEYTEILENSWYMLPPEPGQRIMDLRKITQPIRLRCLDVQMAKEIYTKMPKEKKEESKEKQRAHQLQLFY